MSTAVATKSHCTPEDLLDMADGKSYELVGGQLVERNMGAESSWMGGRLHARLDRFCEERGLGWAFPADNGYECFPHEPKTQLLLGLFVSSSILAVVYWHTVLPLELKQRISLRSLRFLRRNRDKPCDTSETPSRD